MTRLVSVLVLAGLALAPARAIRARPGAELDLVPRGLVLATGCNQFFL